MTVADLSQRLTAAEEASWIAFYRAKPFASERVDVGLAQIAQLLWNTNAKKENTRKLTDFLPWYRKPVKKDPNVNQTVRSMFGKLTKRKD